MGGSCSSAKLFLMQKCTHNANGDVPLAVEKSDIFSFLWDQGVHMFFPLGRRTNLIWPTIFFIKNIFIELLFCFIKLVSMKIKSWFY